MKTINIKLQILGVVFCLMTTGAMAQQQSQYTQFKNAGLMFNPAYAGSSERLTASFLGRWQWVGFEGAPNTQLAMIESAIPNRNIGLGLILSHDEVAITKSTSVKLNYAYMLETSKGILSMGISGSMTNHQVNFGDLFVVDPDNTFSENSSNMDPNFGVGLNFRSERLSVGFSVPEIINQKLEQDGIEFYDQERHIYLSGGYRFPLNESFDLEANALIRMVSGSPLAADMNVMAWHSSNNIGFGLGHRLDESLSAIVQVRATESIMVGYAFDYVTNSQLGNLANTSHEVLLTYALPWDKLKKTKDADNDGIRDRDDECPSQAGPTENNGCPLADSDRDGIPDINDKCPNFPGTVASSGCPDTDGDGVIDREDQCPNHPGPVSNGGCLDSDSDGLFDHQDQCPQVAGLRGFGGCPDTDGDGVKDSEDACPTVAGLKEKGGCPGVTDETKEILAQAIEGVQFESSKDVLKQSSYDILTQVVKVMQDNPQFKLKISGYTDSSGSDDANLRLSKERADRVKNYLVERGVGASRIVADGFGEANPIATNETREGRAKNRRVEFEIN